VLRESGKTHADILVDDLTNEQMLKMMSRENHDAYGTDAWVEMEDIRQTIAAYDRGEIELPAADNRGADVFLTPSSGLKFCKLQIARFLGRTKKDKPEGDYGFEKAWKALDLIKSGVVTTDQFKGLSREGMAVIASKAGHAKQIFEREAKKAQRKAADADTEEEEKEFEKAAKKYERMAETEAKKVAKRVENVIRAGGGVVKARNVPMATIPQGEQILDIDEVSEKIIRRLEGILADDDQVWIWLATLRQHKADASVRALRGVCKEISKLAKRVVKIERSKEWLTT